MGTMGLREIDGLWAAARSVEVRPVGPDEQVRSAMVGDAGEIAELAGLLEVDGTAGGFVCMCFGDVTFTVRGELGKVLGVLTLHLGSGLDWSTWGGQLPLIRPEELSRWLVGRRIVAG
ncbi:hypothetical protein [Streptomyces chattanoogensis]|uniref:Uncharacterized protein n=1 Tax=Streptomyces chattanoogensis TaxID=66876 RepID=A0A0N0XY13_9ACTN|nr:hypothetical protein [Streptomyces chattanoogensis]KPC62875.1 hypothetical protein ADL29_16775 [Streptomyces chattanoogensis]